MGLVKKILDYALRHPVFTVEDLRTYLDVDRNTLSVILNYMVRKGKINRIFRGKYTVYRDPEFLAPYIYYPSYISIFYALHLYGVIEQVPRAIHVVTTRRPVSKELILFDETIVFFRIKPELFFGYQRRNIGSHTTLVATPEKALLDAIYFYGPSILEVGTIHLEELDPQRLLYYSKFFPKRIRKLIKRIVPSQKQV